MRSPYLIVILLALTLTACGNKKKEYSQSFSADDWAAEAGTEGYELPADDTFGNEAEEPDSIEVTDVTTEAAAVVAEENTVDSTAADSIVEKPRRRVAGNYIGNLAEIFNDSNHFQLQHARRLGISPIADLRSYFHPTRPIVKVTTNEDFKVDDLTHSYPFLVPEAEALLHDIGRNFREAVKTRGGGDYRMIVTSLLRTPVTVKKLRRINRNATEQSTHQYATTFDIAYNKFDSTGSIDDTNYGDLKMILAEVLEDLHQQGRCMVKYERKTPCFHITVVK